MRLAVLFLLGCAAAAAIAQGPTQPDPQAIITELANLINRITNVELDLVGRVKVSESRIGALEAIEARQSVVPVWGAAYAMSGDALQAYAPQTVVGVQFYRNGLRQSSPVDFAWSTSGTVLTITPVDPPLADDTFVLDYEYRP